MTTNSQVAHLWVAFNQATTTRDCARSSNGNFSFRGASIFSYQTELARFKTAPNGERFILRNGRSYSITTTSKHQPAIDCALGYGRLGLREIIIEGEPRYERCEWTEKAPQVLINELVEAAGRFHEKAARASRNREWYLENANKKGEDAAWLARAYGLPFTGLEAMLDDLRRAREGAAVWANLHRFFAAYSQAATGFFEAPLRALADIGLCVAWLAGGPRPMVRFSPDRLPTLLRVNGDTVETSHGAEFPLEHGLKALPFIDRAIRDQRAYSFVPTRDGLGGHGPRLGHFRVDSVSAAGWVQAGCHNVPHFAIRWAAREAGAVTAPELDHVSEAVAKAREALIAP